MKRKITVEVEVIEINEGSVVLGYRAFALDPRITINIETAAARLPELMENDTIQLNLNMTFY